jgi:hypothetical protein
LNPADGLSEPASGRWAFKAIVYNSRTCKGFVAYGDADPFNVSPLVRGAEMRVAETRAVNRAPRKASKYRLSRGRQIFLSAQKFSFSFCAWKAFDPKVQ